MNSSTSYQYIEAKCEPVRTVTVVFSSLGIVLSSLALFLLILTAVLFKEWRLNYKNQLLIQFMISRFLYTLVRYAMELNDTYELIEVSKFIINLNLFVWFYTGTAQVAWIFVFTRQIYNSLGKVFNTKKHDIWKVSAFAWMLPLPITVVLTTTFYIHPTEIKVYEIFLIAVKWPLLIVIAITLVVTIKAILLSNKSKPENNPRIIGLMIILIFSFCIQEFIVDVFFVYIVRSIRTDDAISLGLRRTAVVYNIVALYHCALTIMFWLFGNAHTRKLWSFEKPQVRPPSFAPQVSVVQQRSSVK